MGRLDGKVAVITGGGAGIGRATALMMAAEGAAVLVADIDGDGAAMTVAQIQAAGGTALAQVADVAVEQDVEQCVAAAVATFGRLDVLHNNAAYSRDDDLDVVDTPNDAWQAMLGSVLMAAVYGCRYAIPHMVRDGGGSIINMSSGAARTPLGNHIAYGAAKGALEVLTTYTAATFGPDGVRCNAIARVRHHREGIGAVLRRSAGGMRDRFGRRPARGARRRRAPRGVPRVGGVVVHQRSGDRVQRGRCSRHAVVVRRARW